MCSTVDSGNMCSASGRVFLRFCDECLQSSGSSGSNVKRLEDETAIKIKKLKETHSKV